MATRSHTTYKKRQKELARLEKQRDKAAKRMQRKLEKHSPENAEDPGFPDDSTSDPSGDTAPDLQG